MAILTDPMMICRLRHEDSFGLFQQVDNKVRRPKSEKKFSIKVSKYIFYFRFYMLFHSRQQDKLWVVIVVFSVLVRIELSALLKI